MQNLTLAATQMACSWDADENIHKAERLVQKAADQGARMILLQELFQTPYFCLEKDYKYFDLARTTDTDKAVAHFQTVARRLNVVLPICYYERAGTALYNSLAIIDADGTLLTNYRKTHIPHAPGYEEKFYFTPGDTGFQVVQTRYAALGCGICWDQWFPETARSLVLKGAEVLMFPTAIGTEPARPDLDSAGHWQRTMQGHAAANMVPLVASNRVGTERIGGTEMTFYGSSFITEFTGAKLAEANRVDETCITATVDMDAARDHRMTWGIFRDRRPQMYATLQTSDGRTAVAH